MLRITVASANGSARFILEGRLTGLWAQELLRVARGTNQGRDNTFDLQDVFYVDCKGEEALRQLGGLGGRFITESAYGKDLCNRLKLNRIQPSEINKREPEGHRKLGRRAITEAVRPDALTANGSN